MFEGITFIKKFEVTDSVLPSEKKLTCCRNSNNTKDLSAVALKHRITIAAHASRSCQPHVP